MCRKLALAATALLILTGPAFAADKAKPADAVAKPAPEAKVQPQPAQAKPAKASKADRDLADRLDPISRANFWSAQRDIDPADAEAGLKFASALRAMGEWDRAADAAQDIMVQHPDREDAYLDFARARLGGGNGFYAITPLKQAQALNARDWRPLSLLGVAYEQTSQNDLAEAAHLAAQRLAPANPTVLANLAMFRLGQGRAADAEALLRQAAALPDAGERARQDLAFVLGRQGRFDEAEKLMRQDLPPDQVANNISYLRAAYEKAAAAAPRTWDALKADAG